MLTVLLLVWMSSAVCVDKTGTVLYSVWGAKVKEENELKKVWMFTFLV